MTTLALCVPAFDAAWCLPRLLASAASQTVAFDEVWVYDDCSRDDTSAVARRFGARVVRGVVNRGCSHGKNELARRSAAQWIHFHDADDELLPDFVERARAWMRADDRDVVLFGYEERDQSSGEHITLRRFDDRALREDARRYAIGEQINPFCGLYRRSAFLAAGGYDTDPRVLYNEDVALHLRLAFAGLRFAADPAVTVINHRRVDSMSAANRVPCLRAQYHVMQRIASRPDTAAYGPDIARRLWSIAAGLAAHLDWETADAAARLAASLDGPGLPGQGRAFRAVARLSPALALRTREAGMRLLRPSLREGCPPWRPFGPRRAHR